MITGFVIIGRPCQTYTLNILHGFLGSDIGDTLRAFSDEMRDKRLLRAEERANQLPVKMVLPLGTCIFPVVLLVVMLPVIVRLMAIMR